MRVMLRAHIDTPAGNESIKTGAMPHTMKKLMDQLKPEAAYFGLSEGVRTCWIVFDMQDSAKMPPLLEGLFMEMHAEIEISPVMDAQGLEQGLRELAGG
ncbi:hypothetical protein ACFXA3_42650 [Streptomyces sp. NPDC059456]|uniref:hypothetical protein n=1 Tax=Streptomyces sp. NPDC059456 TaxID=3346838 RepID=UPI0036AEE5C6